MGHLVLVGVGDFFHVVGLQVPLYGHEGGSGLKVHVSGGSQLRRGGVVFENALHVGRLFRLNLAAADVETGVNGHQEHDENG